MRAPHYQSDLHTRDTFSTSSRTAVESIIDRPFVPDFSKIGYLNQMTAAALLERRDELGLNQEAVAERLGWEEGCYSSRESGAVRLTAPEFFHVASALSLTSLELLSRVLLLYSRRPSKTFTSAEAAAVAERSNWIRPGPTLRPQTLPPAAPKLKVASEQFLKRAVAGVIRDSRRRAELTEADFADRVGWDARIVKSVEGCVRKVYFQEFIFTAPALDLTPKALVILVENWRTKTRARKRPPGTLSR